MIHEDKALPEKIDYLKVNVMEEKKSKSEVSREKRERLLQLKARKYHIHWYLPRRIKSET